MTTTIKDVARLAGVSAGTVSSVLNDKASVGEKSRNAVRRAIAALNYGADHIAHSLRVLSVQQELFARGCSCSFMVVKNNYAEFLKLNGILRARDVQGVLIAGEIAPHYASALQTNFLNLVFIDYPGDPEIINPYNAVCVDNVYGGHLALNHLLRIGRKRILLICGREEHSFSNDLRRAYQETLAEHRIEIDPRLVVYADYRVKGGFKAAKQLLGAGVPFDALFSNDEMACGAMKALKEAGRKVPEDVSVVGFDGLPIGEAASPTLTTVVVDRAKMRRLAVRRLLQFERETGEDEKFERISIFPSLLVRESCGGRPEKATE